MNKILIVDASESDRRLMSGLLTRAGYEPIAVDKMEAAKEEVAKLPPGAVVVAAISIYFLRSFYSFSFPVVVFSLEGASQIHAGFLITP